MASQPTNPNSNSKILNPKPLNPHASPFLKSEAKKTDLALPLEPFLPHKISTLQSQPLPQPPVMSVPLAAQGFLYYPDFVFHQPAPAWTDPAAPTVYYNAQKQASHANMTPFCTGAVGKELILYNAIAQPLGTYSGFYDPNCDLQKDSSAGDQTVQTRITGFTKYGVLGCKEKRMFNRNGKKLRLAPPRLRLQRSAKMESYAEGFWVPKKQKSDKEFEHVGSQTSTTVMKKKGDSDGALVASVADRDEVNHEGKTSLMIRNIPNQFERHDLLRILDKHCLEENRKARLQSDPVRSEYDFLYLPMDFRNRANYGYAFVNFTNPVAASRFWKSFHKYEWPVYVNKKICEISCAVIQGKDALKNHFRNSVFSCHTNGYLPVVFWPPRDGHVRSKIILVGRRAAAASPPPPPRGPAN
ncbi:hypothetical protein JCGZ_12043 [Jatropha curcas]|uniref:Mei2-like C-terminal RNA recognition motif domain-containing protein n=2 Tax=Jatropha curcas TaxID=180498 RepID=A0A067K969_JATCU|nr:hypothetical protein JCGZ_12043 [Jatropha curcas]